MKGKEIFIFIAEIVIPIALYPFLASIWAYLPLIVFIIVTVLLVWQLIKNTLLLNKLKKENKELKEKQDVNVRALQYMVDIFNTLKYVFRGSVMKGKKDETQLLQNVLDSIEYFENDKRYIGGNKDE